VNHRPQRETLLALADALKLNEEGRRHFFEDARRPLPVPPVSSSTPPPVDVRPGLALSTHESEPLGLTGQIAHASAPHPPVAEGSKR
jgi:hypothetical protein